MNTKKLSDIISVVKPLDVLNFQDILIDNIVCTPPESSEMSLRNSLYAVIDEYLEYGHWVNGESLLDRPETKKIGALLSEKSFNNIAVPQLIVSDARKSLATATKLFYDNPDEHMKIVGVTGTNGKTSTTHFISKLMTALGFKSAAFGTLGIYIDSDIYKEAVYTTPLSPTLFETLYDLKNQNVHTIAMEISSHSIKLDRVFGLDIDVAVFSNLTRDHMDFHHTMDDYRDTKCALFDALKPNAFAVVNVDDEVGKLIISRSKCKIITYGCISHAMIKAENIKCSPQDTQFELIYEKRSYPLSIPLIGKFNVYNVLAAISSCVALGIDFENVLDKLNIITGIPGRVEKIMLPNNCVGIVDYAHSPDSLEKVLLCLRELKPKRIVTVFGCGGDRDSGKRPIMGEIASRLSDIVVVTSDNPRRENPNDIINDILKGISRTDIIIEPNRHKAILKAYEKSLPGDIVFLAGKGHEPYQIIGDIKYPFDDREELRCLNK